MVDEILESNTLEYWTDIFKKNNVICGRVQTPAEVVSDPQALANDFFVEVDHPEAGKIKLVSTPVKFARTRVR